MLSYTILFSLFTALLAFEPPCSSCKYFIPNQKGSLDLGLCKMFTTKVYPKEGSVSLPNFAVHCRNDEHLCGKYGYLHEPVSENHVEIITKYLKEEEKQDPKLVNEYEDLKNRCCGEVNEREELEQLERDFFDIYQKIKSYNTKRIYKSTFRKPTVLR